MRKTIQLLFIILCCPLFLSAQITVPSIKARFGVDADLRANFFNNLSQAGNDDWFNLNAVDTSGKYVIDTTGVAAILASYLTDASPWPRRMRSIYRTMSRPSFSIVNNRLWLDAIWVRDYHGNDTTVFTSGSDKNGMSPFNWTGGVQGIPDKNDILDMFMHVRRAGPNTTDSLWMFGGLSLDNTTGNRYFDFEMYQTDIYYDRVSGKWFGYGPDEGHTSWRFDAAGNITQPGDIIFSGQYQSSTLTSIEARVWVSRTVWQTTTPQAFNWSGQFDGASTGSAYGYASILPKTAGAFYTGLGSDNNTWAGPFRLILQDNSLVNNYARDQFMEFSVNLSKLGLDPVTLIGGDICGTPFNRIVVKTRSSSSFTAELKDFVAPTDLFLAPRAVIETEHPIICDTGSASQIYVVTPSPTSFYQWSTPNGRIVGTTVGPSIYVDTPGVYIVRQYLQMGCSLYASDTIEIESFGVCGVLNKNLSNFRGSLTGRQAQLNWTVLYNQVINYFDIERSIDGVNFNVIGRVDARAGPGEVSYNHTDDITGLNSGNVYYRLKFSEAGKIVRYSYIIRMVVGAGTKNDMIITPNPVQELMQIQLQAAAAGDVRIQIYDQLGKLVRIIKTPVQKGYNVVTVSDMVSQPRGIYQALAFIGNEVISRKILLVR